MVKTKKLRDSRSEEFQTDLCDDIGLCGIFNGLRNVTAAFRTRPWKVQHYIIECNGQYIGST
jgi:hypothetical protein